MGDDWVEFLGGLSRRKCPGNSERGGGFFIGRGPEECPGGIVHSGSPDRHARLQVHIIIISIKCFC